MNQKRFVPTQNTWPRYKFWLGAIPILLFVHSSSLAWAESRPNIVFILADDVGAESMDMYGGTSWPTPTINSIATDGMLFENAFSAPTCAPTRAQFMTGRYQFRHGITFPTLPNGSLSTKEETTFATILKRSGYATGVVGKWHLFRSGSHGDEARTQDDHLTKHGFGEHSTFYGGAIKYGSADPEHEFTPYKLNQWACDFIKRKAEQPAPFYLQYSLGLVHWERDQNGDRQLAATPLNPNATPQNSSALELYAPMMTYMDQMVGNVLHAIDSAGIANNTVVVFAGDNGTWNIITSKWNGRSVQGGKKSSKDTGSWVPFYVRWPGVIEPGSTYSGMTDFSDIFPTFIQIAGAVVPNYRIIDGISFLPQLKGLKSEHRNVVYSGQAYQITDPDHRNDDFEFVRDKNWKLIIQNGAYKLYDVSNSPLRETFVSVSRQTQEQLEARERLRAFYDQLHNAELAETGVDSDGDGQTDFTESISGTDPLSAASKFEITAIRTMRDPNGLTSTLMFETQRGRQYHILHSDSLHGKSWIALPDPVNGSGREVAIPVAIPVPTTSGQRFYKVQVEKSP